MLLLGGRLPDDALILSYAVLADVHGNPTCLRLPCHARSPPFHDDEDPRVPSCTQYQDPGHTDVVPNPRKTVYVLNLNGNRGRDGGSIGRRGNDEREMNAILAERSV